jgi:hypothetical protein
MVERFEAGGAGGSMLVKRQISEAESSRVTDHSHTWQAARPLGHGTDHFKHSRSTMASTLSPLVAVEVISFFVDGPVSALWDHALLTPNCPRALKTKLPFFHLTGATGPQILDVGIQKDESVGKKVEGKGPAGGENTTHRPDGVNTKSNERTVTSARRKTDTREEEKRKITNPYPIRRFDLKHVLIRVWFDLRAGRALDNKRTQWFRGVVDVVDFLRPVFHFAHLKKEPPPFPILAHTTLF